MLGMTTRCIGGIVFMVAIFVVLLGSFFQGIHVCGGSRITEIVGQITLASMCFAVVMRWCLSKGSKSAQSSLLRSVLGLTTFIVILIIGVGIAYSLGWVVYYSPTSVEDAYREFMVALMGGRPCG
jgi:hypothetical protein